MAAKQKRKSSARWLLVPVVIGGYLGVHAHPAHGHHGFVAVVADAAGGAPMGGDSRSIPAPPAAGGTRESWAQDVLRAAHLPVTVANVRAIVTWTISEGGGWGNQAANNPLNLNPGSAPWPGHAVDGAWAFPDWWDGVRETAAYLWMPNFAGIRAALERGDSEHAIFAAIVDSPWAGSHYAGNQVMQQALRDS